MAPKLTPDLARPAIHFLPSVWPTLCLSYHATANELWNKIFLMIIFSQEINFHQRHKCIDSALSLINILSYRTTLACLKINGAAFQMEPCFWSIQMCRRLFTRGDLNPAVYVAAAHMRVLVGLLMVTCLFTLVPPRPPSPASGCLQPAGFCCPRADAASG